MTQQPESIRLTPSARYLGSDLDGTIGIRYILELARVRGALERAVGRSQVEML